VNRPFRTGGETPDPGLIHNRPTTELWRRLARPYDSAEVAEVLLGIPADVVGELADSIIATGPEAGILLDGLPSLMRRLNMGSNNHVERSASGVRGPILWSETVAAQSSSLGHSGVYVCSIAGRDYDIPENRVLVDALKTVVASGERLMGTFGKEPTHDPVVMRARHNTEVASRYLGHRALAQVGTGVLRHRRSRRSLAAGRHGSGYRPAVALLERAEEPFESEDLSPYCSRVTRTHHELLVAAIEALESCGQSVPPLRTEDGAMVIGPFLYIHPLSGRTGSPDMGVLHDDRITVALDPLRSGPDIVPDGLICGRRLVQASTTVEVAELILGTR